MFQVTTAAAKRPSVVAQTALLLCCCVGPASGQDSGGGTYSPLRDQPGLERVVDGVPVTLWYLDAAVLHNRYPSKTRQVLVRLAVRNESSESATIGLATSALTADGLLYPQTSERATMRSAFYEVDGLRMRGTDLPIATAPELDAGKVAIVGLAFDDLPMGLSVPSLSVSGGGLDRPLDLRELADQRAAISTRRVGPANAIGLVEVRGHLDRLSAQSVCDRVTDMATAGVQRVSIHFGEEASVREDRLYDWLVKSVAMERSGVNYHVNLPVMPGTLHAMRLSDASGRLAERLEQRPVVDLPLRTATTQDRAIAELAAEFTAGMRRLDLLRRLRTEDEPGVRAAYLDRGRDLFAPQDLPVVRGLLDSENDEVRLAAVRTLAAFPQPETVDLLLAMVSGGTDAERQAAREALSGRRFQSGNRAAAALPQTALSDPAALRSLLASPEPAWAPKLKDVARSKNPEIRGAALAGLIRLGGPGAEKAVTDGVLDDAVEVRQAVVQTLQQSSRRNLGPVAEAAAVRRLRGGTFGVELMPLLSRLTDREVTELLTRRLPEFDPPTAAAAIQLILRSATRTQEQRVVDYLLSLPVDETVPDGSYLPPFESGLRMLAVRRSPRLLPVVRRLLQSRSQARVSRLVLGALAEADDEERLVLLVEMLSQAETKPLITDYAQAIAGVGTAEAAQALRSFLRFDDTAEGVDLTRQAAAADALDRYRSAQPAAVKIDVLVGNARTDLLAAEQRWKDALLIDPQYAPAFVERGLSRIQRDPPQYEAALEDFRKAVEADRMVPGGHVGVALAEGLLKRPAEAYEAISRVPRWMLDREALASYNAACAYGIILKVSSGEAGPGLPEGVREEDIREEAFRLLGQAVTLGFTDFAQMRVDPDLEPFRGERMERLMQTEAN